jgi:peptidoglycan/LPS O-acetylase OafA/YrhL
LGVLRLFLAFAVLMEHFSQQVLHNRNLPEFDIAFVFNINGARAVLLFYVISGFLISYALHHKYEALGTLAFYRARFLRIYPLWWAVFIVTALLSDSLPLNTLPSVTILGLDWSIAFWQYPDRYWGNVPANAAIIWTLAAELTFYLIAPWLLRRPRVAIAVLVASFLIRTIIHAYWHKGDPGFANLTYFFFPAVAMFFMLGHLAEVLSRRFPIRVDGSVGLLLLSILLFWRVYPNISLDSAVEYIAVTCFALSLPGIFAATKDIRWMNCCGDLTFPLYITHSLTIGFLFWPFPVGEGLGEHLIDRWLLPNAAPIVSAIVLTVVTVGAAIIVAGLAHAFFEEPLKRAMALLETNISPLAIPAYLHDAMMKLSREQRQSWTAVNEAVRLADPDAQR